MNGFLQIIVTKPVQFELYAIMRAARLERKCKDEKYKPYAYSHEEILNIFKEFPDLFNIDNCYEWNQLYAFRPGYTSKNEPFYKKDFIQFVRKEYGFPDLGLSFIEEKTRKSKKHLQVDDRYDYPIMAAALLEHCHVFITDNLSNFAIPLGTCLVINHKQANEIDFFDEYFDEFLT